MSFVSRIHYGNAQPRAVGDGFFFTSFFTLFLKMISLKFNIFFFFSLPIKGVWVRDAFAAGGWCCVIHDVIVLIQRLSAVHYET